MDAEFADDFLIGTRTLTIGADAVEGVGEPLEVINPATEEILASIGTATLAQADAAVAAARSGFDVWRRLSPARRSRLMHDYVDLIERERDQLVATIVNEVGSPVSLVRAAQRDLPVRQLRWYADVAARDRTEHLGPVTGPATSVSQICYRPVGVVVAIAAYNYPFLIAALKLGAALAAGCSVVLMPSPRAPMTALHLGELARRAGLPPGVVNVVTGGPAVGEHLVSHPGTDKVSFTGSVPVGSAILTQAAPMIKGVTLELGGKGPSVILPDADMATATRDAHQRWARNAGQVCTAPTRVLVHESAVDEFVDASRTVFDSLAVGAPWRPETVIGPLIRPDHRDRVRGYVDGALGDGASVLAEGRTPLPEKGWYLNPVLLGGLDENARAVQEEIFGPVAVVQTYRDEQDAVRIANSTLFGLSASVYTADLDRAFTIAESLRSGTVWINGGGPLRPDAVFGGFGVSGLGREQGEHGLAEFLEPQHVQWAVPS